MSNRAPRNPGDVPADVYKRIQGETQTRSRGGGAAAVACVVFVLAAVLLVVALEAGVDIEEILLAAFVVGAVNLVAGVLWVTSRPSQ